MIISWVVIVIEYMHLYNASLRRSREAEYLHKNANKKEKINKPSAPLLDELSHEPATTTSLMPCQTLASPQVINLYHIREKIGNM